MATATAVVVVEGMVVVATVADEGLPSVVVTDI
jgi:hypothetical protein